MKLTTKCHLQALSDIIEISLWAASLSLIGSAAGLYADLCWVGHDISVNGLSAVYAHIQGSLRMSFTITVASAVITMFALYKHHVAKTEEILTRKKLERVARNAKKNEMDAYKTYYKERNARKRNKKYARFNETF